MIAIRVAAVLIAFAGIAGAAPKLAPPHAKTGPHGGVVVQLGTHTGEFSVWNTMVKLYIYDGKGKLLHTKGMQGTLEVSNFLLPSSSDYLRPEDLKGDLTYAGDHLEAQMRLGRLVRADFKVSLLIDGVRREGTVTWVHTNDRSRLGDWFRL
jgi:hypothetical protein